MSLVASNGAAAIHNRVFESTICSVDTLTENMSSDCAQRVVSSDAASFK